VAASLAHGVCATLDMACVALCICVLSLQSCRRQHLVWRASRVNGKHDQPRDDVGGRRGSARAFRSLRHDPACVLLLPLFCFFVCFCCISSVGQNNFTALPSAIGNLTKLSQLCVGLHVLLWQAACELTVMHPSVTASQHRRRQPAVFSSGVFLSTHQPG